MENEPKRGSESGSHDAPELRASYEAWFRFTDEVGVESDRACVVIAAILLEEQLENLLRRRLIPNPSSDDRLFEGPNAPAGNFAGKIDLAYRLGLLPPKASKALHLLRKLRNHVAHNMEEATFEHIAKQDRIREMVNTLEVAHLAKGYAHGSGEEETGRTQFELAVGYMLECLERTEAEQIELTSFSWDWAKGIVMPKPDGTR